MKSFLFNPFGFLIVTVSVGQLLTSPAQATTTAEAIRSCDQNPKCDYQDGGNGDIILTAPGGVIVICEKKKQGNCEVQKRPVIKGVPVRAPILDMLKGVTKAQ